ncbi:CD99 antigen-like protein 2 isoform X2 [Pelobates fuscus]|uniref:CD99 antigen-like protein 2 isoform X2 n=1 Tax=Pelobates fuscus TaxID=191477 RepID=UPI002FE47819
MMAARASPLLLSLALLTVCWKVYGGDFDDFNLEDALDMATEKPKPKPPKTPAHKPGDDFDLSDFFDTPSKPTTKPPRPPPKKPGDLDLSDFFDTPSKPTAKPARPTIKPPPKKPDIPKNPGKKPDSGGFDLSDALDEKNDPKGSGTKIKEKDKPAGGSDFSDSDLEDIVGGGGYSPDKKKGGHGGGGGGSNGYSGAGGDSDSGGSAEPATIAGVASGLAMALLGAVVSYISYQQKKFCFRIQESLNAEYVKGEQAEGVVCEEPPVKYSVEEQTAAPPTQDPSKV